MAWIRATFFRTTATSPLFFTLAPPRRAPLFLVRTSGAVALKVAQVLSTGIYNFLLYLLYYRCYYLATTGTGTTYRYFREFSIPICGKIRISNYFTRIWLFFVNCAVARAGAAKKRGESTTSNVEPDLHIGRPHGSVSAIPHGGWGSRSRRWKIAKMCLKAVLWIRNNLFWIRLRIF